MEPNSVNFENKTKHYVRTTDDGWFSGTHLLFLHVEVFDDDADEEVEREEGAEDDEEDEVEIHPVAHFTPVLFILLYSASPTQTPLHA